MEEILKNIYEIIINLIYGPTLFGPILACLLIIFESIIPILPLFVFITVVFLRFGIFIGFILSWILTIIGCVISFLFVRYISDKYIKSKNTKIYKLINIIEKLSFSELVIIIAIPFTPAFLINIAAGLSNMSLKRFLVALCIGKISLIAFWGFIGTSLIESLLNPIILFKIGILLLFVYLLSIIVNKKFNIT